MWMDYCPGGGGGGGEYGMLLAPLYNCWPPSKIIIMFGMANIPDPDHTAKNDVFSIHPNELKYWDN